MTEKPEQLTEPQEWVIYHMGQKTDWQTMAFFIPRACHITRPVNSLVKSGYLIFNELGHYAWTDKAKNYRVKRSFNS